MLAKLIYSQLPKWAHPTHPMMRYAIGYQNLGRRVLLLRLVLGGVLGAVLVGISYAYVVQDANIQPTYRAVLYYPLVAVTLVMQLLALAITANTVALERQKGTWDSLQITLVGAASSIRTRWALVFYRLRWLLGAVVLLRLGYIALLLRDMTDFEGRAIDVRIIGIAPEVTLEVAVFLLAALMTAAILQPFVALAFDASLGLLVAALARRRAVGILTTVFLLIGRMVVSLGALLLGSEIINANGTTATIVDMPGGEGWFRTLWLVFQGDLSLRILNLETLGNLWADLPSGIYLGGVVLGGVLLQALLANGMVRFAAWWASRPSRY